MKKILQILILGIASLANAQTLVRQFTFDNTLNDTSNTDVFTTIRSVGGSSGYFTKGRTGAINTAYHFGTDEGAKTQISSLNLPLANTPRAVAVWVKFNYPSNRNYIFSYGTATANNCFGLTSNHQFQIEQYSWGSGNSIICNLSTALNSTSWYHFVTSFDGTNIKIYINGVLVKTQAKTLNTQSNNFYLGTSPIEAPATYLDIDDLRIYDGALSDSQVLNLYNNNTLSTNKFQQNSFALTLQPNPVHDLLNLQLEGEIKTVEIYNLQGQKVLTTDKNQVNVTSLSNGMYMIRVQTTDNKVVTQKFIKE